MEHAKIIKADLKQFLEHKREILDIERELIENSSSAYFIDEEDEMEFMTNALEKGGYAYLVTEKDIIVGFMVVGPLADGSQLPNPVTDNYPTQNCLHIKMMYVKNTSKGIGTKIMEKLVEEVDKNKWKYLFVRTWVEPANEGAIKFYTEKCGFEIIPDSIVKSTKTKLDQGGTFNIKRQYFSKALT